MAWQLRLRCDLHLSDWPGVGLTKGRRGAEERGVAWQLTLSSSALTLCSHLWLNAGGWCRGSGRICRTV